ncbi:hypothetical protein S7711_11537 [Stachybotrys chartarum IBT 7711]|uniref:Ubiquitin-like protease family profile domain-containing protein n=1 Tax=Stachybotrys chartarum (strain CBS 109288 / IBT 7711) TaxID=1280523 RepID=A0A084B2W3_STACB|nr:hypothetical protein S7711_11537 [Stachybotrys chartarum IBT 7711]
MLETTNAVVRRTSLDLWKRIQPDGHISKRQEPRASCVLAVKSIFAQYEHGHVNYENQRTLSPNPAPVRSDWATVLEHGHASNRCRRYIKGSFSLILLGSDSPHLDKFALLSPESPSILFLHFPTILVHLDTAPHIELEEMEVAEEYEQRPQKQMREKLRQKRGNSSPHINPQPSSHAQHSSIPALRSDILNQVGCSESQLDTLVGQSRPATWNRLSKFLQNCTLDWDAAHKLLERSKLRPERRKIAYLLINDIDWAENNTEAALVPDSAVSGQPPSPTDTNAEDFIPPSMSKSPLWTAANFALAKSPMPSESTSVVAPLQLDSDYEIEAEQNVRPSISLKRSWENAKSRSLFDKPSDATLSPPTKRPKLATTQRVKIESSDIRYRSPENTKTASDHNTEISPADQINRSRSHSAASDSTVNKARERFDTGGYHWALAIINETRLSIQIYDSLPSLDLQDQIESKLQDIYKKHSWPMYEQLLYNSPIVQQNGYDCGIMVLIAVSYRAAGFEVPSGAEHSPWRIILFGLLHSRKTQSIDVPESYKDLIRLLESLSSSAYTVLTRNRKANEQYLTSQRPSIPALRLFQVLHQAAGMQKSEAVVRVSRVISYLEILEKQEEHRLEKDIARIRTLRQMITRAEAEEL